MPGERPQVVESGGRVHLHELLREGVRSGEDRHGKVPDERLVHIFYVMRYWDETVFSIGRTTMRNYFINGKHSKNMNH